jgi:hypothetical protein
VNFPDHPIWISPDLSKNSYRYDWSECILNSNQCQMPCWNLPTIKETHKLSYYQINSVQSHYMYSLVVGEIWYLHQRTS